MAARLEGKTAVVTGGSRGIGAGIARRLAAEGARVVITYAGNEAAAKATIAAIEDGGGTASAIQADAGDPRQVRAAIESAAGTLGGIDILVHNAGIAQIAPLPESTEESFRRQFAVNVEGIYVGTKAAIDHMRDGGRIIIIGSVNGQTTPVPGAAIYGATKSAVAGLARGWARDLGPRSILVNVIQPGPIDTDLNPADSEFAQVIVPYTALGRYGTVEDVAALAAFLASDEAGYITGTTIDVDGGFSI